MAFDVNSVPLSLTIIFGLPRSPIVARPMHIRSWPAWEVTGRMD
jgi:hypothetical protein